MKDVFEAALEARRTGARAALVTVISTEGSTPQKAGAKMVVYADGRIVGTIGGGCVEAEMTWRARQTIEERRSHGGSHERTAGPAGGGGPLCGRGAGGVLGPLGGGAAPGPPRGPAGGASPRPA